MSPDWLVSVGPVGTPLPIIITVPHSGEWVPPEATHLQNVDALTLLTDVDRFVHELYGWVSKRGVWFLATKVHRYAVDLNRIPEDIDRSSVDGANLPTGMHTKGFHWVRTTQGFDLIKKPLTMDQHEQLTKLYYDPFMDELQRIIETIRNKFGVVIHIDAHSMPGVGTSEHADPGQVRKDVVVSDHKGKSCTPPWMEFMVQCYSGAGFKVSENWPYTGGRLSGITGNPQQGVEAVQVELNRRTYMDEKTREKLDCFDKTRDRIMGALDRVFMAVRR